MSNENWKKLIDKGRLLKLVSIFKWEPFYPQNCENINIDVYETSNNKFIAFPREAILSPGAGDPYYSPQDEECATIDDTLEKVIFAYEPYLKEGTKIVKWPPNE